MNSFPQLTKVELQLPESMFSKITGLPPGLPLHIRVKWGNHPHIGVDKESKGAADSVLLPGMELTRTEKLSVQRVATGTANIFLNKHAKA